MNSYPAMATNRPGSSNPAASCVVSCHVAGPIARMMLPFYNVYEQAVRFSPFENWLGTFLVSFGVKRR